MYEEVNPYQERSGRHIYRRSQYFGQDEAFSEMERKIRKCLNTVILGPEGMGKTEFLNCLFNRERRMRLALEERVLVSMCAYPTALEEKEEIYAVFSGAIRAAADILEEIDALRTDYEGIQKSAEKKRREMTGEADYLQQLCQNIADREFQIILVMDQFEGFANSPHVLVDHHDILRQLLVSGQLRMIVATDYDFNMNTLPPNVSGSYLLQMFAGNEVVLRPLDQNACRDFLENISGREDFSEQELENLRLLSGGIPELLRLCACHAWQYKQLGTLDASWEQVREESAREAAPMMRRWLKLLDEKEAAFLRELSQSESGVLPISASYRENCAPLLKKRGLIRSPDGSAGDWCVTFNSVLLWDCCVDEPPTPNRPESAKERQGPTVHQTNNISGDYIAGDKHEVNAQVLNAVLPTRELLEIIVGEGGTRQHLARTLYSHITQKLPTHGLAGLELPKDAGDWEYDGIYDAAFEKQVNAKVVGEVSVNEDGEILDVSEGELATLDHRFQEARRMLRRELSDELLERLSTRTNFYLKMAVVVEDALSVMKMLRQDDVDCSAQLVLYGKALEQQLRDSLYPVFHCADTLKDYKIPPLNGGPTLPFGDVTAQSTSIGNYIYALKGKAREFAELCAANEVTWGGAERTVSEWSECCRRLSERIRRAHRIRNKADHADPESPNFGHVDEIASLCFGEEEAIFKQCLIGNALHAAVGMERMTAGTESTARLTEESVMRCTKVNAVNRACQGMLQTVASGCQVKISKKKVEQFRNDNPGIEISVGRCYRVRLGKHVFQDGAWFYRGELVGTAEEMDAAGCENRSLSDVE